MKRWTTAGCIAAAALATCWAGDARAQAPASQAPAPPASSPLVQAQQDAAAVVATMGKNMKALTTYTYQQRIQMAYDGEVKSTTLNQISFDATGKPVVLQLSVTKPDSKQRRLGHRAADRKKAEIEADVKQLVQLSKSYLFPDQPHMEKLALGAVSYEATNIMIAVKSFEQPEDAMTITAAASNMTRTSAQVTTVAANKSPVTIAATYSMLDSGLNYLSHYVVTWPSEKVQLTFDTLNYQPAQH